MKYLILIGTYLICLVPSFGQETEQPEQRKNTIKFDATAQLIYNNAFNISYERVTKPNQTVAVTVGYQEFPKITNLGAGIKGRKISDNTGFKFGGEYRFYLKKENKYLAPRGVYIGPYFTFLNFNIDRTIEVDNNGTPETAILNSSFRVTNLGFQMGYQFLLNNRWAIDLILIGPSVSNYSAKVNLGGTYTFDKDDIQNEIVLKLIERFPALDQLITDKELNSSGRLDTWAYGWRYQLHVGYHFGRK